MPQVPYNGTLQIAPGGEPTPRYQVDAPPEAFGVNVGQAVQHLGTATQGAGNEIFARGIAMQDLYNHSEALEADAKYSAEAGQIYEKMKGLSGKNAVDYYTSKDYEKELTDARTRIRGSLSNPMAQKMYDSSTLSTFTRTNLYGASYSGEQNRHYAVSASTARVKTISDEVLANPNDDVAFQSNLAKAQDEIRSQTQIVSGAGPEDPITKAAVAQKTSELWSQRISGVAQHEPVTAGKMLEQALKAGQLQGEDIAKTTNFVQQRRNTIGARIVSNQVSTGGGVRYGQGPIDIGQAAEAIGQIESGGRYDLVGVQTSHGRALGKYQVMEEFLPEFLQKAGLPPMSTKDFLNNKSAQDQVFTANFGAYMKQTGSANDAASMWLTGKPLAQAGNVKDALGTNAQTYVARFNAALAKGAPLSTKVAMGKQIAGEQAPDDPLFPDYVQQRIETDHNQQIAIKRDDEFNNRQTVETALMGGQSGKLPTTVDEITADPKQADAWNKLLPSTQRRYMNVLAHNAKGDFAPTAEGLVQKHKLIGMATADPASFVDQDIVDLQMPLSWRNELMNLQDRIRKGAGGNPAVNHALSVLEGDMDAAKVVYNGKDKDNDNYYKFVGQLADQLASAQQINQRPPKDEEIRTIGNRILQVTNPDRHWWQSEVRTYQTPVPEEEVPKIQADYAAEHNGLQPTDLEIQRRYMARQYQKLHGKSVSATPTPQVPRSQ